MNKFATTLIAGVVAQVTSGYAFGLEETEENNPLPQAQYITADSSSHISINGMIGQLNANTNSDLDFFEFYARQGDVIDVDIDHGMDGQQPIDTLIAIFDENGTIVRENDQAADVDEGSVDVSDARIDKFVVPATGTYKVGVSNFPRKFKDGGDVYNSGAAFYGDYELNISGISDSPAITYITMEVKPGQRGDGAPINPRSKGKIPVALLSSQSFKPMTVDVSTLRFGRTGTEDSLSKCNKDGVDLNHDGVLDMICHFENQAANFDYKTLEGIVTGQTTKEAGSVSFEGHAPLKVAPQNRK